MILEMRSRVAASAQVSHTKTPADVTLAAKREMTS